MIVNGPGLVKPRGNSMELTDLSDVVTTLCDFAGASLPEGRVMDGVSLAPYLRGDSEQTRDWIFSFIGDRRILRTKRWLLEDNSPLHYGRLYDCGEARDGDGYREATNADAPEALAAKDRFNQLLAKLPAPVLPEEGEASAQKPERAERKDRRKEQKADAKSE
jgi:arylsulfatase A-like enzyme